MLSNPEPTGPPRVLNHAQSDATLAANLNDPPHSPTASTLAGSQSEKPAKGPSSSFLKGKKSAAPAIDQEYWPEYEATWDGPDDPTNPYNWSSVRRWYIVFLGAMLVFNATFASSATSSNIPSYMREFGISRLVGTLTTSLFVAGYCVGPLAWGALSEVYGRRNLFIISFIPYVGWCVGCALSQNIASLLVFRFLGGAFAAAPLCNAGALVGDVLPPNTRGIGMSLFALAPIAGPAFGPVVGGFVQVSGASWRLVYWALTGFAGVATLAIIFTLPETYAPLILQRKAAKLRQETGDSRWWSPLDKRDTSIKQMAYNCGVAPFMMLIEEPMLLAISFYLAYIYGILYLQFGSLPYIFMGVHGFSAGINGLCFLPVFLGGTVSVLLGIFYYSKRYAEQVRRHAPNPVPPEARLDQTKLAVVCFPIAMFWLGWTGNFKSVSYWSPLFAVGLFGVSVVLIFVGMLGYLVDTYLARSATALSVNIVLRSTFGAGFPLFTPTMLDNLGIQWSSTVLGCIALVGMPIPFILIKVGPKLRAMSKNAARRPAGPPPAQDEEAGAAGASSVTVAATDAEKNQPKAT